MKGVIILPKYLKRLWHRDLNKVLSANAPFFYAMRDTFGFELRYADEVDVGLDTDILFMFGVPYHNRPKLIPGLLDLPKNTKLIMWPGDLQCYGNRLCLENKIKVFERCDLIVSPAYEYFAKMYPQFLSKYKLMPKFFSPHERYVSLPFNKNPKMRCLLSGAVNPKAYPLRDFVRRNSQLVDYRPAKYVGDSYAKLLHSYFCCFVSSSIFNYVVAKHYEIPATGSLLLADETNDLKRIGFVAHRHYVPVTKRNVIKTIKKCIANPKEYENIRKEGMNFVRKNHSVINRMDEFKEIFVNLIKE
jgi:hypothetical protein